MKVGTKIVCIKDLKYSTGLSNTLEAGFIEIKKGEIFKLIFINNECLYIRYNIKWDYSLHGIYNQDYIDVRLELNHLNILWCTNFYEYFITLAEFREDRINKILEI